MHRFPQRTRLDVSLVEEDAQCLHIVVRLAVGVSAVGSMHHTCGTAHRALNDGLVGILLTFYADYRVNCYSIEPEIGIVTLIGIAVNLNTFDIFQQFLVELEHMLMMVDMVVHNGHLSATDAGADVAHAVVVSDSLVLVVGI